MAILGGKVRVAGAAFDEGDVLKSVASVALVKFLDLLVGGKLSSPEVYLFRFEGPAFCCTGDAGILAMLDRGDRDGERPIFDAYTDAAEGCDMLLEA
jgi:hypothetical protein